LSLSIRPSGYNLSQIALHWIIAALVVFQLIFGDDIKPAYRTFRQGNVPSVDQMTGANLHVYIGILVLALAILRLAIRLRRGVPPAPPGESRAQRLLASLAHLILYLFIFLMPITGMLAWYGAVYPAGELHETAKPFIIIVVALHALAALWQHFVAKTDVLMRMLRPVA